MEEKVKENESKIEEIKEEPKVQEVRRDVVEQNSLPVKR
jgi:hypothetical protein